MSETIRVRDVVEHYLSTLRQEVATLEEVESMLASAKLAITTLKPSLREQLVDKLARLEEALDELALDSLRAEAATLCREAILLLLHNVLNLPITVDKCLDEEDVDRLRSLAEMDEETRLVVHEIVTGSGKGLEALILIAKRFPKVRELAGVVSKIVEASKALGVDGHKLARIVIRSIPLAEVERGIVHLHEAFSALARRLGKLLELKQKVENSIPSTCTTQLCSSLRRLALNYIAELDSKVSEDTNLEELVKLIVKVQAGLERVRKAVETLNAVEGLQLEDVETTLLTFVVDRGLTDLDEVVDSAAKVLGREPHALAVKLYELCRKRVLSCKVSLPTL
jgi:hypothetical protein